MKKDEYGIAYVEEEVKIHMALWKNIGEEEEKLVADILIDNNNLPEDNKLLYWEFRERLDVEYPAKDEKPLKSQKSFINKIRYMRKKIKNNALSPIKTLGELAEILLLGDMEQSKRIGILSNYCVENTLLDMDTDEAHAEAMKKARSALKNANPYGHKATWVKGEISSIEEYISSLYSDDNAKNNILTSIAEYNTEYGLDNEPIETITKLHLYQMALWRHTQEFDPVIPREVDEIEKKIKKEFSNEYLQELCEAANRSN